MIKAAYEVWILHREQQKKKGKKYHEMNCYCEENHLHLNAIIIRHTSHTSHHITQLFLLLLLLYSSLPICNNFIIVQFHFITSLISFNLIIHLRLDWCKKTKTKKQVKRDEDGQFIRTFITSTGITKKLKLNNKKKKNIWSLAVFK